MTSQLNISNNKTRKETSLLSNTPTHVMFESHPFVVQSKSDHHVEQPNLKTSFIQAEKYGHHLSKTNLANQSVPTAVQAKPNMESPVQFTEKRKEPEPSSSSEGTNPTSQEPLAKKPRLQKTPQEIARAWASGARVRQQVKVTTEAPGIINTRIHKPSKSEPISPDGSRLGKIMGNMGSGDTYNRLRVMKGADSGRVIGTTQGQRPQRPQDLVNNNALPEKTAVMNGGYFVMNSGLTNDQGQDNLGTGRPVGPTSTRPDHTPIPQPWQNDYGNVMEGNQVGVSSGPVLEHNNHRPQVAQDDRFKFRLPPTNNQNPLNSRAGALTHANERNPRAAISLPSSTNQGDAQRDAIMHTLTVSQRGQGGATMPQWQNITRAGAAPRTGESRTAPSTLNLDGGGSVYMGITQSDGSLKKIAQQPNSNPQDTRPRAIPNMIASRPSGLDERLSIST